MEEAHVIPLWQGINPAVNDSKWCWFRQTSSRKSPTLEICLLHAQWSDFWSAISVTRVAEAKDVKKLGTPLDLCVSSLRRGHANLLCIVPILSDDPRRESIGIANAEFRAIVKAFTMLTRH